MRTAMLCLAAGIAAVAWWPQLPPVWLLLVVVIGCAALGCGLMLCSRLQILHDFQSPHKTMQRLGIAILASMLGICWGCGYGFYIRSGLLPVELEQQSLLLRGRVVGLVEQQTGFQQRALLHFQFEVDPATRGAATPSPRLIQLNWYDAAAALQAGEYWQLRVKLKRPRGFANPAGFDYAAWLVANRIGATGYVERSADNQRLASSSMRSVDMLRGRAQSYLQQRLHDFAHRDLLLGLLIGDGGAIATTEWETFRATGTVHLFVVSGLQIAFTGGIALWCSRLWWRSPLLASRRSNYLLGSIPALAIALAYALLAGWGLPIQRALIMFAVLMWALIAQRKIQASTSWLLALLLVLLADPLAGLDAGFWFSFIAVAAILLVICGHREQTVSLLRAASLVRATAAWWRVQWAIFATSLPLLLWLSGQFTLLTLPANLIAIPLSTFISLPLAFIALLTDGVAPRGGEMLWQYADRSLDWLWRYLLWLQQHGDFAIWHPLGVTTCVWLFTVAAAGLMLLPRGIPGKGFALLLLLPLAAPPLGRVAPGAVTATVIDVGQGLSVLIETAQHRLLYDTGPLFGPERTVAELTAAPLLRQRGISTLDAVIVSHHDSDHAGGWPDIEREFSVHKLLVGENIGAARAQFCGAGMQWRWDDVDFEILHPVRGDAADAFVGNNRSCVLQISAGDAHILLTGDIERSAEYALLDNSRLQPATLLLAPHHGSRSSSTAALIERLKPQFVVFSAGYRNRFGHPSAEVEQRYRASGALLFNTANDGALTFNFQNGHVVQIARQRSQQLHYWD